MNTPSPDPQTPKSALRTPHCADAFAEQEDGIEQLAGAPVRYPSNAAAIEALQQRLAWLQRRLAEPRPNDSDAEDDREIQLIRDLRAVREQLATYQALEQQRN